MKKLLFIEGYDAINYDKLLQTNIKKLFSNFTCNFFSFKNSGIINDILQEL